MYSFRQWQTLQIDTSSGKQFVGIETLKNRDLTKYLNK